MLINHYTDHKQHTTQPEAPDKPSGITSCGQFAQQVLNVNPTACLPCLNAQPKKRTHTHHPQQVASKCRHKKHTPNQTAQCASPIYGLPRKEVIQPHLPVRLPCYDFVPIANPTFDHSPQTVRPWASGVTNFRDVTGGVYKARERIHRSVADLRLLATPPSRCRVADTDPN